MTRHPIHWKQRGAEPCVMGTASTKRGVRIVGTRESICRHYRLADSQIHPPRSERPYWVVALPGHAGRGAR